ncbi:hypothetical protein SKAU_G00082440 [Synaphobranchus kaupii]|uniref:Testis-expressed sequence 12 protein n=1 Tax=Synaphobranchus kaupii TaxID=118154 RepID=A0A9Q1FV34_SYNKA|nr:hypothetical protein SKAU_G00082440 [Synaphobranchus kaupii]
MTGRGKTMSGRGVDSKGPKIKMTKEVEEATMYCESSPLKKKRPLSDKSPALNSLDVFQAAVTDANREVNVLFSKYAEVMSERAAVDGSQVRELEDIVKEVKGLESHLMERKEQLRRSLAVISDKLQG